MHRLSVGSRTNRSLCAAVLLTLVACGHARLEVDGIEERSGVMYESGSIEPFTGTVYAVFEGSEQVATETEVRRGRRHGRSVAYHENGKRFLEEEYRNGKKDGVQRQWYDNGQLWREGTFRDGLQEGMASEWNEDGQLSEPVSQWQDEERGHVP